MVCIPLPEWRAYKKTESNWFKLIRLTVPPTERTYCPHHRQSYVESNLCFNFNCIPSQTSMVYVWIIICPKPILPCTKHVCDSRAVCWCASGNLLPHDSFRSYIQQLLFIQYTFPMRTNISYFHVCLCVSHGHIKFTVIRHCRVCWIYFGTCIP